MFWMGDRVPVSMPVIGPSPVDRRTRDPSPRHLGLDDDALPDRVQHDFRRVV